MTSFCKNGIFAALFVMASLASAAPGQDRQQQQQLSCTVGERDLSIFIQGRSYFNHDAVVNGKSHMEKSTASIVVCGPNTTVGFFGRGHATPVVSRQWQFVNDGFCGGIAAQLVSADSDVPRRQVTNVCLQCERRTTPDALNFQSLYETETREARYTAYTFNLTLATTQACKW